MKKNTLIIALLFISNNTLAQYNLQPGSIVQIDNVTGDIAALTDNQNLQCGDVNPTGVIEYLECGFGTTLINGQCSVGAGQSFEIDYGLTGAESCIGQDGTSQWMGPHFIGTGTGDYSYNLSNGINQQTTFTLGCNPQPRDEVFNKILHRGVINLKDRLRSGILMAQIDAMRWKVNLYNDEYEQVNMDIPSVFKINQLNEISFMIRQQETELHIIPTKNQKITYVDSPKNLFETNTSTYMFITGDSPSKEYDDVPTSRSKGKCDSFSGSNQSAINVVFDKGQDGCFINLEHNAYLVWYLLEDKDS